MKQNDPPLAVAVFGGAVLAGLAGAGDASARPLPPGDGAHGAVVAPVKLSLKLAQIDPPAIDLAVESTPFNSYDRLPIPFDHIGDDAPTLQYELTATRLKSGLPVDLSFRQHVSMQTAESGAFDRRHGSEFRIGRTLEHRAHADAREPDTRVYAFVASGDEALTWNPDLPPSFGGSSAWRLQDDRVEIGDHQIGFTYEVGRTQTSFVYVQRDVSATVGRTSFSNEENFVGLTFTMRT